MALTQFQVRLQAPSNLPEDVYENVLYFEVNAPDSVGGLAQALADLYISATFLQGWTSVEVRAYDFAGGQPIASYGPIEVPGHANAHMPAEVAVCLSYAGEDDPEVASARRRGRIYLGPWYVGAAAPRPEANIRDYVLDFGEQLASLGSAGNTTWMIYSRTDNQAVKIESIWADDSWDTQRRRGPAPTLREVRDVQ